MKPTEHVNLVAILHIAWSVLLLIASGLAIVLLVAGGFFADVEYRHLAIALGIFICSMLVTTGVAGIFAAWGLLKRRGWARLTIMVLSAIWLIKIPVGTALGVYSFYALTRPDVSALFEGPRPSP